MALRHHKSSEALGFRRIEDAVQQFSSVHDALNERIGSDASDGAPGRRRSVAVFIDVIRVDRPDILIEPLLQHHETAGAHHCFGASLHEITVRVEDNASHWLKTVVPV